MTDQFDKIIGEGPYDNIDLSEVESDRQQLQIKVRSFPLLAVIILNIVFICFFGGFSYLAYNSSNQFELGKQIPIISIYFITAGLFTLFVKLKHQKETSKGTYFIYNKKEKYILLPRQDLKFSASQVDQIQYISTKYNDSIVSELNIIIDQNNEQVRYPILKHVAGMNAFPKILKALKEETNFMIVRTEESIFKGKIRKKIISNHA